MWIWSPPLVLFGDRHSGRRGTRHGGKRAEKAGTGLCTKLEGVKLVASGNSKKCFLLKKKNTFHIISIVNFPDVPL